MHFSTATEFLRINFRQHCFTHKFTQDSGFEAFGLLICTLISENQGLFQTLEKFQVMQICIFFQVWHLDFFQVLSMNPVFFQGGDMKKSGFAEPEIFLRFDFQISGCRLKGRVSQSNSLKDSF